MFLLIVSLFVILQCQYLVSTNNVIEWTLTGHGYQIKFPWLKTAQIEKTVLWETTSPSGFVYKVECNVYESINPKADIFTKDGILIDSVFLDDLTPAACDEGNLKNYITPQDPKDGVIKMVYLWSGRKGTCVERKYKLYMWSFMVSVQRFDYPNANCPDGVKEFLRGFDSTDDNNDRKLKPGGVVTLAPVGYAHLMDYANKVLEAGQPETLYFAEKDIEGKRFKLICRDDITTLTKIVSGSIVHEDDRGEDIVLEKFTLTSCSTDNININRQILYNKNRFKVVFKTVKGICYEREYTKMNVNFLHYYDETSILRMKPVKITCPKTFKGDININEFRPWYMWSFKRSPFSKDLRTKEQKEECKKQ